VARERLNCWEYQRCGRELGGPNVDGDGPCPASTDVSREGLHSGCAGGRACWSIEGTLCEGCGHNTLAEKRAYCVKCAFYNRVFVEEGPDFDHSTAIPRGSAPGYE
jgi:hypothetical protein